MKARMLALACLLPLAIGLAQPRSAAAANHVSRNEAAIRRVYEGWAKALQARDIEGIMSFYAPDVVAYDIVPPLRYRGKDAYRKDYEEFLDLFDGPMEVEFRDLTVVAGRDVGFIHGLERVRGTMKNGQKFDAWIRVTSGLRKLNGQWLIVHDHVSVPADFDSGKAVLDLQP